jgi:WD40 repeat protein
LLVRPGLTTFLQAGEGDVRGVAFSPDGTTLAAGYGRVVGGVGVGGAVLWDVGRRARLADQPLPVPEGLVTSVAFSPDGKTLATGYGSADRGGVVLWDVARRARLARGVLPVPEGFVASVAFSPDGRTLAAGYRLGGRRRGGGVVLWDVGRRARLAEEPLAVPEGSVRGVAFSPDGRILAAGVGVGGVVLWDVGRRARLTGKPLAVAEGDVRCVAFSPDGCTLAAGYGLVVGVGRVGGVVLWDVGRRARLADQPLPVPEGSVRGVAFSPNGHTLAAGYYGGVGSGGGAMLWDVGRRARLADQPLAVPEGGVWGVAFSPDGHTLAAGYGRVVGGVGVGGAVLGDVGRRARLANEPLAVAEGDVRGVAFSPDGTTLAAGYRRGDVRRGDGVALWDVDLDSWARLAGLIASNLTRAEWRQYFPDRPEYHPTFPDLPVPPPEERPAAAPHPPSGGGAGAKAKRK